ncbi:hypothetical protein PINS_up003455 [Pythium insidiosum]|nr:hypothetical protein PINS_up003455 [Pythium insidiosum]
MTTISTSTSAPTPLPLLTRSCSIEATSSSPVTPLRRTLSTPSSQPFLTPVAPAPVAKPAFVSVSPFEKAALVHAKDTPGKVDKFEWRIRSSDGRQLRVPGTAFLPVGAALADEQPATPTMNAKTTMAATDAGADAPLLPPPYLVNGGAGGARRRVHSTTFGAFARSFSFTNTPTSR